MNDTFGRDTAYHVRRLVDHVPSMLAYWGSDLRCRFANRAYSTWFGVDPESLPGTSIRDLLGPQLFALNEPHIRAALRGEEQLFERIVPGPGGVKRHSLAHYIPDLVDGQVVGFMVQVTEVTRLKETEAALRAEAAQRERAHDLLRRSESALREAQRLGQIGSWEWEVQTDITIWSEELCRIHGVDPKRLPPGRAELARYYTPESWARLNVAAERALATGEPYTLELQYLRPDGSGGWLEARGEAVRDEDGQVVKLRGTAMEITVRRQMQEAQLQRDVAQAANRNKTEFLSRISHELRTPLNAILGFAQLIQTDSASSPKQAAWATHVVHGGRHMLALIEDILDLSAAELGRISVARSPVRLGALVGECIARIDVTAAQANVRLVNEVPADGTLVVLADATRLQQVINNLLSNAVKYSRAGGTVRVTGRGDGSRVEIAVHDQGPGMSAEQLGRLFTPFERLGAEKTAVPGTGIGLALSRRLVELMGGAIRVSSEVGVGSTFVVSLPR